MGLSHTHASGVLKHDGVQHQSANKNAMTNQDRDHKNKTEKAFSFFWLHLAVSRICFPTRDQTIPPTVEAQCLNHWTTREVPFLLFKQEDSPFHFSLGSTDYVASTSKRAGDNCPRSELAGHQYTTGRQGEHQIHYVGPMKINTVLVRMLLLS